MDKKVDMYLGMAKMQGYVVEECTLPGMIVMALVNDGKKPCKGCNIMSCSQRKIYNQEIEE